MTRKIYAVYDDEGISVYQAFSPFIAQQALKKGTFGDAFKLDRMTWIKPSFGWMLYRCSYATKPDQEAVLRIKLSHEGFKLMLRRAVPSTFEPSLFADQSEWQQALKASEIRYQWDPDRDLRGEKLERRAIQIGVSGKTVMQYVNEWIIKLEDVTSLARAVGSAVAHHDKDKVEVPKEREYSLDTELQKILRITI